VNASTASVEEIASLVPQRCSASAIQTLSAPFSPLEIKNVFFSLPRNKAPGPAGYCVEFFTAHWETVGHDMVVAVYDFLQSGQILKQWNSTLLTLVPKTSNATKLSEFRPIACCNTIYKVVSKILANRLKSVLPELIANSQSAFIPGRLLVENVLLATELIQGYNHKNISARGMLKVDLKKAFDSVHWEYILNMLKAMCFPSHFIRLIGECITTTRFSVCVNGETCGFFKGTKGLRQGDPLSPYLFVLAMEGFTQMLTKSYNNNLIGRHPSATNPLVSHLAFADDIMVFFDGNSQSLEKIADVLQDFSVSSGLSMNKSKTDLILAGVNQLETSRMTSIGFNLGSLPFRYLGLPLMHRKLRNADYRALIDKITGRFSSWSARALSYAGRKELISSVIYGTVNFWASAFILPKGCLKSIESLCSRFLWNGDITKKAAAKVAWETLCLPKQEGGLGFRSFSLWNKTLCLKLIWRLFSSKDSLWAEWQRQNRIKDGGFWMIDENKQTSWTWKSLLRLRPLASSFIRGLLGDGKNLSFWFDWWTPMGPLINFLGQSGPSQTGIALNKTVAQVCSSAGWNLRPARSPQAELLHIHLTTVIPPDSTHGLDSFVWKVGSEEFRSFSTSKTWDSLRQRSALMSWTEQVWFKGAIPRHAFLSWLTHLDRLPTRERLVNWGLQIDTSCCLCGSSLESRDHLFLHCEVSQIIWAKANRRLGYTPFLFHTWDALSAWLNAYDSTSPRTLRRLVAQAIIYGIWRERNNRYHNNISTEANVLFKALDRQIRDAILGKQKRKNFRNLMRVWLKYD